MVSRMMIRDMVIMVIIIMVAIIMVIITMVIIITTTITPTREDTRTAVVTEEGIITTTTTTITINTKINTTLKVTVHMEANRTWATMISTSVEDMGLEVIWTLHICSKILDTSLDSTKTMVNKCRPRERQREATAIVIITTTAATATTTLEVTPACINTNNLNNSNLVAYKEPVIVVLWTAAETTDYIIKTGAVVGFKKMMTFNLLCTSCVIMCVPSATNTKRG